MDYYIDQYLVDQVLNIPWTLWNLSDIYWTIIPIVIGQCVQLCIGQCVQ
jgi:hypothetical protein